jgi:hypothetical protein
MAWIDRDGDGFHDETGESRVEYDRRAARRSEEERQREEYYRNPGEDSYQRSGWSDDPAGGGPGSAESSEGSEYGPDGRHVSEHEEARRQRDSSSGDATGGYSDVRSRSDEELGVPWRSDGDAALEGSFLLGDLGGSNARMAGYRQARQEAERQAYIDEAEGYLPSADDLYVQYEEEGLVDAYGDPPQHVAADAGAVSSQQSALDALEDIYQSGGMTAADRARQRLAYEQAGMAARGQREADAAALSARGMGGGGASVASMLSSQGSAAQSRSAADAQMLIDAQRRELQAMQAAGGLATQRRGQSFDEGAYNADRIDRFNREETDYRRRREGANTDRRNQTRESRRDSRQQAFANRLGITDRRVNYSNSARDPSEVAREGNEATGNLLSTIGDLI